MMTLGWVVARYNVMIVSYARRIKATAGGGGQFVLRNCDSKVSIK